MPPNPPSFDDGHGLHGEDVSDGRDEGIQEWVGEICGEQEGCCDDIGHESNDADSERACFPCFVCLDEAIALFDGFNALEDIL